jgi:hypothetical protein
MLTLSKNKKKYRSTASVRKIAQRKAAIKLYASLQNTLEYVLSTLRSLPSIKHRKSLYNYLAECQRHILSILVRADFDYSISVLKQYEKDVVITQEELQQAREILERYARNLSKILEQMERAETVFDVIPLICPILQRTDFIYTQNKD